VDESKRHRQLDEILGTPLYGKFLVVEEGQDMSTASEDKTARAQVAQLNERFAGLEGHLFGRDGSNGAFGELKADIKTILKVTSDTKNEVAKICERHNHDMQEMNMRMALQKKDIDNIGNIARTARDSVDDIKLQKGSGLREFGKKVLYAFIPIVITGLVVLLTLGLREWVAS